MNYQRFPQSRRLRKPIASWADAVGGDERFWLGISRWDAGRGDRLSVFDAVGDGVVEVEELGQEVGPGGEAVGGEDGGVERGVSVFQGIRAGQLQRAIYRVQAAGDLRERLGTHATHLTPRLRHRLDLLRTRRLRCCSLLPNKIRKLRGVVWLPMSCGRTVATRHENRSSG